MKNQVNLIGHVGGTPEITIVGASKTKKATFSLATNKTWKNENGEKQDKVQWHNITAWGKKADVAEAWVKKGSLLSITGELEYRSYENKDGHNVYATTINVEDLIMITTPKEHSES